MLKVGDKYEYEFSYTQQDVELFARVTGDNNPIHIDAEFAKTTPFGRPIMHGFLSGAVFSKVFGTLFTGKKKIVSILKLDKFQKTPRIQRNLSC